MIAMGLLNRLDRERRTVAAMVAMYCRDHHGVEGGLCDECRELEGYAGYRLDKCPYGEGKPTCVACPIHCYGPEQRERVQRVMRYSGPRMMRRHPLLAVFHLFDARRRSLEVRERGEKPTSKTV